MSNVIFLMNDTLRRDHVGAYGLPVPWDRLGRAGEPFIRTPNLDRLAAESALFERFYCASYPTIPCRYDCFSGRYGFPTRGWQPLERDDVVLSEVVQRAGLTSMLIYDTPMLGNDSYNYTRGFAGYDFVRGHHGDRYNVDPITPALPAAPHKLKNVAATRRYLRNTARRRSEADWMVGQTISTTLDWLERNRTRHDFVLWVDMWDPHEPFDAPSFDLARYADPSYTGDQIIYPQYGRGDYMTEAERNHVRALYAALVTCVDRWVGRLLEKLETLGLDRDTLLLYLSDHGHLFGDHGLQGKPTGPFGQLYEVTTRVPLLIRHPEGLGAGRRIPGLAQHPDLLPTALEFLGLSAPAGVGGKSLWPLINGSAARVREFAFSGRYSRAAGETHRDAAAFDGWAGDDLGAEPVTVASEDWAYLYTPAGGGRQLYDLRRDPGQTANRAAERPDIVQTMHAALLNFLDTAGAPADRLRLYQEAAPKLALQPGARLWVTRDGADRRYAFASEAEAAARFDRRLAPNEVAAQRFGDLVARDPRCLVYFHEQFYWAEDLG